jgi:hypothetical protein
LRLPTDPSSVMSLSRFGAILRIRRYSKSANPQLFAINVLRTYALRSPSVLDASASLTEACRVHLNLASRSSATPPLARYTSTPNAGRSLHESLAQCAPIKGAATFQRTSEDADSVDNCYTSFIRTKHELTMIFTPDLYTHSIALSQPTSQPISPPTESSPTISATASPTKITSSQPPLPKYRYKIFPDFQTSFLFYDDPWPHNPSDTNHVEWSNIKSRYPGLYPSYSAWHEAYELAFDRNRLHLGSGRRVFEDRGERHTWSVEGFFWRLGWY